MSFAQSLAPHLPFLRRYARALTGNQQSGDNYIRVSLTALSETPDKFDTTADPRLELYRFFHTIWEGTGARLEGAPNAADTAADMRLVALAPVNRQAFLLQAVEGFSREDCAYILDRTVEEVDELVARAHAEIEAQLKTSVLVIEDEPIIAADLESIVEDLGHTVLGNATTRDEAVEMAGKGRPGLILCDIQLADNSSGIDAAKDILAKFDVPVIFITAFPERLLTGERPEPTYLISKPFREQQVKAAIGQALFFHAPAPAQG
ncbi:MAG: response regulator [Hyphomonadaceae bacterium]